MHIIALETKGMFFLFAVQSALQGNPITATGSVCQLTRLTPNLYHNAGYTQ